MSGNSNSQSLQTVSLKFDPGPSATVGPIERAHLSLELDRAQKNAVFEAGCPAAKTSMQVLAEVIEFAYREKISDLQFQAGRFIYANGSGSTRPCEQWGKLSGAALREILELFSAHRS